MSKIRKKFLSKLSQDHNVAILIYLDESNDILMNSFNFEFNTMNILKEENILKAIELIITEKNYYLILEEPQGESFRKILNKNGSLKEKDLRTYLKKLRTTFATLEKNKIIHG